MGIDRQAVGRDELPRCTASISSIADPGEHNSGAVDNTDPWAQMGETAIDRQYRAQFTHVTDRAPARWHEKTTRPMDIAPLGFETAIAVKNLYPMAFAISNIDPAIVVTADVVGQVKFTRPGSRGAPGQQMFTLWGILVNSGITIPVGYIDGAIGRERRVGAAIERIKTHERRRLTGNS